VIDIEVAAHAVGSTEVCCTRGLHGSPSSIGSMAATREHENRGHQLEGPTGVTAGEAESNIVLRMWPPYGDDVIFLVPQFGISEGGGPSPA
jgi:hypothetical protein